MKTVYTIEICEEGLRSDGFYVVKSVEHFYTCLKIISNSKRKATIYFRKHEVKNDCDICCGDSVKETLKFYIGV